MTTALERAIASAKESFAAHPESWGTAGVVLDSALTPDPIMHDIATSAINRLTAAVKVLRPAGAESQTHIAWRAQRDALQAKLAAATAAPDAPGSIEIRGRLIGSIPKEPPFDDGGAATVTEHATALGGVQLLLGVYPPG